MLTKTTSILCLLVLLSTSYHSYSQKKVFQHSVNWSKGKVNLYYFPAAHSGQFALTVASSDSLKTLLITDRFRIRALFTVPSRDMSEDFSGGFVRNDSIVIFLRNESKMRAWTYDMKTKKTVESNIDFNPRKEKDILTLNTGSKHVYVTFSKNRSVIMANTFGNPVEYKRAEYDLDDDMNLKAKDVAAVNEIDVAGADFLVSSEKFYSRNDTLYFTSDRNVNSTEILAIDLKTGWYAKRTLTVETSFQPKVSNSFLLDNKLYVVNASRDEFALTVADFYSGKELARLTAKSEEEILFANTPLTIGGGGTVYSINRYREVKKAKIFLDKLVDGELLVGASKNDTGVNVVTIGAVKNFRSLAGGSWFGGTYAPAASHIQRWKRVSNFKVHLDAITDKPVPGDDNFDLFERIDQYKRGTGGTDEGEAILNIGGLPHFVFYDRNAKKLCIVKM